MATLAAVSAIDLISVPEVEGRPLFDAVLGADALRFTPKNGSAFRIVYDQASPGITFARYTYFDGDSVICSATGIATTADQVALAADGFSLRAQQFAGADTMTGSAFADRLLGFDGDDAVDGGAGNDDLNGNKGVDLVFGDAGHDTMFGGQGKTPWRVVPAMTVSTAASATIG